MSRVALTITMDRSIVHKPWKKGSKLKRRPELEKEARQNESEIHKARWSVRKNKNVAKQATILILSSSLA